MLGWVFSFTDFLLYEEKKKPEKITKANENNDIFTCKITDFMILKNE